MAVRVGDAFTEGWDRFTTETGGKLVLLFVLVGLVSTVVSNSFQQALREITPSTAGESPGMAPGPFPGAGAEGGLYPLAVLDLPLAVLGVFLLVAVVVQMLLYVGAIRWFVEADPSSPLRPDLFTRRILWTVGNLIVGGIIFGVAVGFGFLLLFVPGVFLLVALYFFSFEIIVEGENGLDALVNSWNLTKGDRLELFSIGVVFLLVQAVVFVVYFAVLLANPVGGALVNVVLGGMVMVFSQAVGAAAYNQLRATGDPGGASDAVDTTGPQTL